MGEVSISVAGRAYQVVCEDGEEDRLAAIAARVDREAQTFGGATPSLSESRLLLMCALLLADKLDEAETAPRAAQAPAVAAEIDTSSLDEATARIEALANGSDVPDVASDAAEPAAEPEAGPTERRSKSSAAVAAEKDLLSWAERPEGRDEAEAADDSADDSPADSDAEPAIANDTSPEPTAEPEAAPDEAAEEAEPAETEEERIARERAERRRRRRERLARLAKDADD